MNACIAYFTRPPTPAEKAAGTTRPVPATVTFNATDKGQAVEMARAFAWGQGWKYQRTEKV